MKRSRALRGRNPARNNRIDGAPRRGAPDRKIGSLLSPFGHLSHASNNPGGLGAAPPMTRDEARSAKKNYLCRPSGRRGFLAVAFFAGGLSAPEGG